MEKTCTVAARPQDSTHVVDSDAPAAAAASTDGTFPIPTSAKQIVLRTGEICMITGPNGVGKSGLLAELSSALKGGVSTETFFGNRNIQFQDEEIDQVGRDLITFNIQLENNVTRFRHPFGEQHLKYVVRRVINKQTQALSDRVQAIDAGKTVGEARAEVPLILDALNSIFSAANIPIEIVISEGTLSASRGGEPYSLVRLSDGERAALLVVGAVLVQPADSYILIDEPERHLNPAISGALLAAMTRARLDLGYVFTTHDLDLLAWLDPQQIIHLRDSDVINTDPEKRNFEFDILGSEIEIPEELRSAILGSRRKLLLVEGTATSEDIALYRLIYTEWDVAARGGCVEVISNVKGLLDNEKLHWLKVAGIIDADGREADESEKLAEKKVFCLPCPMIENLFLDSDLLAEMAAQIHKLKGGDSAEDRLLAVDQELANLIPATKDEIIVKRLLWKVNRLISEQKPSEQSVREGQGSIPAIGLGPLRTNLENKFDEMIVADSGYGVLSKIPIKNTAIPNRVCKRLGFQSFDDYKRSVLKQIEDGSSAGQRILDALRTKMPNIE